MAITANFDLLAFTCVEMGWSQYRGDDAKTGENNIGKGKTDCLSVDLGVFGFGIPGQIGNCDEERRVGAHY